MTKLFHEEDCPNCRFNHDNYCCSNPDVACRPSDYDRRTRPIAGFTPFKGTTRKHCHKIQKEESESVRCLALYKLKTETQKT